MIETAIEFLLKTQNADGGWGSQRGRRSSTESTALAVLALDAAADRSSAPALSRGIGWLAERQNADGSWPLATDMKEGSWATALAMLSLAPFEAQRPRALRGAGWLEGQKGSGLGLFNSLLYRFSSQHRQRNRLNPDLKGWSWTPGAFSWVEPTSYALIALKKLRPYLAGKADERIRQGELMIYDRMCQGGGWNYGNSRVLGEDLWPYPDITALALIALQDHETAEANQRSLATLRKMLGQNGSGLTLSWSILCFSLYDQDVAEWRKTLAANHAKTGFLGETKTMALALLAMTDGPKVFRV